MFSPKQKVALFFALILVLPQVVSAAWWNPFSWGHRAAVPVVAPAPKTAPIVATTTRPVQKSIPVVERKVVPLPATNNVRNVVSDPAPTYKPVQQPVQQYNTYSNDNYYTNVDGNQVHSPVYSDTVPAGASARCRDGTYSFSQHRSGTCSRHGGVAEWL